jgi:hypothetical protein
MLPADNVAVQQRFVIALVLELFQLVRPACGVKSRGALRQRDFERARQRVG